ncbi:MAG: hypothetical protein ABIA63_13210 [bacterium]
MVFYFLAGIIGFVLFSVLLVAITIQTNQLEKQVNELLKHLDEHIYI